MSLAKSKLFEAEKIAQHLYKQIEGHQLIKPGKTEHELNEEIFELNRELFTVRKF